MLPQRASCVICQTVRSQARVGVYFVEFCHFKFISSCASSVSFFTLYSGQTHLLLSSAKCPKWNCVPFSNKYLTPLNPLQQLLWNFWQEQRANCQNACFMLRFTLSHDLNMHPINSKRSCHYHTMFTVRFFDNSDRYLETCPGWLQVELNMTVAACSVL